MNKEILTKISSLPPEAQPEVLLAVINYMSGNPVSLNTSRFPQNEDFFFRELVPLLPKTKTVWEKGVSYTQLSFYQYSEPLDTEVEMAEREKEFVALNSAQEVPVVVDYDTKPLNVLKMVKDSSAFNDTEKRILVDMLRAYFKFGPGNKGQFAYTNKMATERNEVTLEDFQEFRDRLNELRIIEYCQLPYGEWYVNYYTFNLSQLAVHLKMKEL